MAEIFNNYDPSATYEEIVARGNPLPQEFIDEGISSWACGPNSWVAIFEDDNYYFSDQVAASRNSYTLNNDVTTSLASPISYMEVALDYYKNMQTTMFD